jgi:hypothetical protein
MDLWPFLRTVSFSCQLQSRFQLVSVNPRDLLIAFLAGPDFPFNSVLCLTRIPRAPSTLLSSTFGVGYCILVYWNLHLYHTTLFDILLLSRYLLLDCTIAGHSY